MEITLFTNDVRRLLVILFIAASAVSCAAPPAAQEATGRPAHHAPDGFKNLYIDDVKKSLYSVLRMRYFGDIKWPNHAAYADDIPRQALNLSAVLSPNEKPRISWLGHSTFLIQHQGINVLTDPVFSDRTSPVEFFGPKRYTAHVVDYKRLPPIHYVVISHNHYDHLDSKALDVLLDQARPPRYYVPLGIKAWLVAQDSRVQPETIVELDWGQHDQHNDVKISAYPSQHWSARSLTDRFKTLWASWRIELGPFSVWFAGDTGYNERLFRELGETMPPVDVSLIPIGAYSPRDFMKAYHMNPEEAVQVHQQIKTRQSIGMHWGTYPLTAEAPTEPPVRLEKAVANARIPPADFSVMSLGETLTIDSN